MPILSETVSVKRQVWQRVRFLALMLLIVAVLRGGLYAWSTLELIPAIYDGDYRRVKTALAWGADVNACKADGFTPLMRAVSAPLQDNKRNFITLLLAHGAKVNQPDAEGRTALDYVQQEPEIAGILKQHGAREKSDR